MGNRSFTVPYSSVAALHCLRVAFASLVLAGLQDRIHMVQIRVRAAGEGIVYGQQLGAVISLGLSAQLFKEEGLDLPYHKHQVSFHTHWLVSESF